MNPHIYSLMSGLTHLDLGDNEFKYLGTDWFTDLKRLQVLEIDGNHFPVVLEGTFGTQYKLQELVLSRNRLAKVTTHAFTNLSSLVDLDLSYNKLIKLETQTLAPMTESLRSLKVSGNNLDVAELTFVLQSVTKLRELAIADMSIASEDLPIGMLVYQENLRLLNLSGNEFTHFPVQVLSPVPKLSVLDLSRNKFQGLDERLVARLESVGTVRLERNPWSCDLCHITPLLSRVNRSASFKKAVCSVPAAVKGRTLESLNMASLSWCGSGVGYRDESFAGLPLTHNTQLGLIAAGAAVALLVVTAAAIVAGLLYNKHHAAYYYTHEEKRGPEHNAILQKNGVLPNETVIKKVSIATIDEITKDPDLQVLANGT
ncbi:hypothetical protein AAG570_001885 [Ranatra chinensis]|uniref:Uncharacterized protein n=1 Tax=Ranatra chinensis TaxID=642074 RepID=A0ABD0Y9V6_9HEMI